MIQERENLQHDHARVAFHALVLSQAGGRGARAPPNFGRSVNPISTGEYIMPTALLLAPPTLIFRPYDGPVVNKLESFQSLYKRCTVKSSLSYEGQVFPTMDAYLLLFFHLIF